MIKINTINQILQISKQQSIRRLCFYLKENSAHLNFQIFGQQSAQK